MIPAKTRRRRRPEVMDLQTDELNEPHETDKDV